MNAIGIALVWCVVQVTLIGLLAGGLYLAVRQWRPAAAASVVLTGLAIVVVLSVMALSPWPRWTIRTSAPSPVEVANSPLPSADGRPVHSEVEQKAVSVGNPPSDAALLWQAWLNALSKPQPAAVTNAWRWPATVAVLLMVAMACGLGWLVLGVAAVRRQRLRSPPVLDGSLLELVDVLCAELGCRRRVEVRQADDLVTAATIGWRRPVVLLPADWTVWTADQRRAVLAHEIVHARSHDFLALLVGQLGLVLHLYHPLMHWLIGRLRLEQELAADAAAASVSGGQRQYLMTIAELALRQPDRPLLWPARTFLPTRTTFLRRIAMLRDSKLRFDRLSPIARLTAIVSVLLCGLLVAGVRGPSGFSLALADEPAAAAVNDSIDTTHMIEKASAIVAMRPAAGLARPELAELAKLLEMSGNVIPKGTHMAEIRQVTVVVPEVPLPSGPNEIVVTEFVKPVAEKWLRERVPDIKDTGKQHHGKKIFANSSRGRELLVWDDHTVIESASMDIYLAGKPGVLPKWLPAKAWESFRCDHFVIAADTAMMRREVRGLREHSPPLVQASLTPISALCEATGWLGLGARLDERFTIHACATANDADALVQVRRTAEALQTLLQIAAKGARTQIEANQQVNRAAPRALLDVADRLLDNLKFHQDGNELQLRTSVAAGGTRLIAVMSAFNAVSGAPLMVKDPGTKQGMMALVEDFFNHNFRDITSRETIEWGDVVKTSGGNSSIRYKYRCSYWYAEPKIVNQIFTFDSHGTFVSVKDVDKRPPPPAKVYQVHKKVADFPDREDLSTPEAAYATLHRAWAREGDAVWPRLCVPSLAARVPAGDKRPLPKERADQLLGAEIVEVHVWDKIHAVVIAAEETYQGRVFMDMRWLTRVDGRWLNDGNDGRRTLEEARQKVEQSRSH
jgi:beta-lactamase regulating signal transducer with metallopeptidase domain